MTTTPKQIGPYLIDAELGRGGMGVVYRATDTRLDRAVAIKALPDHLAENPDRLTRFEREAKTLASLNHPNVAGIHGVEEHDGARYLILEFVEGETLAERLRRGPLPVDEALDIAAQVAAGVEAAHEAGVVHRDLKPGNIIITPDGKAKVLDFGLSRTEAGGSLDSSISQAPTMTTPASPASPTEPGAILGTAPYMSPEQARGRRVDKRSDIWSFGVLLYEILTGVSPFTGETATDAIGAILHITPDYTRLPARTPPLVRHILERCIERDRDRRYRDIGDVRVELLGVLAGAATAPTALDRAPASAARRASLLAIIVLVASAAGLLAGRSLTRDEPPVRRYELPFRTGLGFATGYTAISPEGSMVAYQDGDRLWLRRLDDFDATPIQGSEGGLIPFWSPDGAWIGFARAAALFRAPIGGGEPALIARTDTPFSPVGGVAWSPNGQIYYCTGDGPVHTVPAAGGEPRVYVPLAAPDDDDFHNLALLPDGKSVVFTVHSRTRPWYLAASDGVRRTTVIAFDRYGAMAPAYDPAGYLLFDRFGEDQGVWAVPFDAAKLETTGEPFLVSAGDGDPSVNARGTLAFTRRRVGFEGGDLSRFDLDTRAFTTLAAPAGPYYDPALSPDGALAAVAGFSLGRVDLWIADLQDNTRTRLTYDDAHNEVLPRWSPDGSAIAYARTNRSTYERAGPGDTIHFVSINGDGETRPPVDGGYPSFNRDWTRLALARNNDATASDIYALDLTDPSAAPVPVVATRAVEEQPALSPDGALLAYVSDESGMQQVYLTRFPSGEGKWQVSTVLSTFPIWSADGTRLYFAGSTVNIFEVEITNTDRVRIGPAREVLNGVAEGVNPYLGFTTAPDGNALTVIRARVPNRPSAIGVIENWRRAYGAAKE